MLGFLLLFFMFHIQGFNMTEYPPHFHSYQGRKTSVQVVDPDRSNVHKHFIDSGCISIAGFANDHTHVVNGVSTSPPIFEKSKYKCFTCDESLKLEERYKHEAIKITGETGFICDACNDFVMDQEDRERKRFKIENEKRKKQCEKTFKDLMEAPDSTAVIEIVNSFN